MWKHTFILFFIFIITGGLGIEDGFSSKDNFVICRNPFCSATNNNLQSCAMITSVSITQPLNGSSYFWTIDTGSPLINTTITSFGSGFVMCQYRTGGLWNNFTHCNFGENGTWDMISFPEGYPTQLDVNISNSCSWIINTSDVAVYGRPGGIPNNGDSSLVGAGMLVLILTFIVGLLVKRKQIN